MTTLEYIKELTAGECPDWVCEQAADEIDRRDTALAEARADLATRTAQLSQVTLRMRVLEAEKRELVTAGKQVFDFLYRVRHWEEGTPDLHGMKELLRSTLAKVKP